MSFREKMLWVSIVAETVIWGSYLFDVGILMARGTVDAEQAYGGFIKSVILLVMVEVAAAIILAIWYGLGTRIGRVGFYVLFACAVTMSVQLVGLYLVFATLIIPALATREYRRKQLVIAYIVALAGYALGLALSDWLDWPSGPVIVWTIAIVGILTYALRSRRA